MSDDLLSAKHFRQIADVLSRANPSWSAHRPGLELAMLFEQAAFDLEHAGKNAAPDGDGHSPTPQPR